MTAPLRVPWARPVVAVREGTIGVELVAALASPTAWAHLLLLHAWASVHRPTGDLQSLHPAALARAADWPGDPATLAAALASSGALVDGVLVPLALPSGSAIRKRRERAARRARRATGGTQSTSSACVNDLCRRPIVLLAGESPRLCQCCEAPPVAVPTLAPSELRALIYAYVSASGDAGAHLDAIRRHCAGQSVENIRSAVEHLQGTHRILSPRHETYTAAPRKRDAAPRRSRG